jgi:GNAT superfamily N-acetyltransferase
MAGKTRKTHVHGARSAKQLSMATWPDFDRLFAANNGVWGGCWCTFFHTTGKFDSKAYDGNRRRKHSLVVEGHAHGTIVYCGTEPVAWCQFGPKEELVRIDGRRGYSPTAEDAWRITCLFISRAHRRMGFADMAVAKAVDAMKKLRVKSVEAYPVEGRLSATFLWSGTPELFERAGFSRVGPLGKNSWIYSLKTR